jgi:hypothetical protein
MSPHEIAMRPIARRRLEWFMTELGVAGALLMEVAWVTPWFRYFNQRARVLGQSSVLAAFLMSALLAMTADRVLKGRNASGSVRALVLLALLSVEVTVLMLVFHPDYPGLSWQAFVARALASLWTVLDVIPAELVIILSALYIFRRGIHASIHEVLAPEKLHFRFRLGILILAAFGLVFRAAEGQLMLEVLPVFFGTGLLALVVSRVDRAPPHAGSEQDPMRMAWVGAMFLIILITLGLSQGVSSLLRSSIAEAVVGVLATALLELLRIVVILIGPLIQLSGVVLGWFLRATAGVLGGTEGLIGVAHGMQSLAQSISAQQVGPPTWLQIHAREIAAAVTVMILALLTLVAIRGGNRAQSHGAGQALEESESLAPGGSDEARSQGAHDRPNRRGKPSLAGLERFLAATSIRRIYGRLLRIAKARGRVRSPSQTPLEFLPDLQALFPSRRQEVDIITHAYLEVQYGGRLDEEAGIAEVRRAWAVLQNGGPMVPPSAKAG